MILHWSLHPLSYITHYSYFGSFRSDKSNVGPTAAMLTAQGKLTDIGSWYLGGVKTGNIPSAAGHTSVFTFPALIFAVASLWCFL
jgi:hypothetical protein